MISSKRRVLRSGALLFGTLSAAVAVVTLAHFSPQAAAGSNDKCSPLGGIRSDRVVREGSEVTEFLPGGAYRVSRCSRNGKLRISMTVAAIKTPTGTANAPISITEAKGDSYVTYSMLYGEGEVLRSWSSRGARQAKRLIIPPTSTGPRASTLKKLAFRPRSLQPAGKAQPLQPLQPQKEAQSPQGKTAAPQATTNYRVFEGNECNADGYNLSGNNWVTDQYAYMINFGEVNKIGIMDPVSLNYGHYQWSTIGSDNCAEDLFGNSILQANYSGSTAATFNTSQADGINTTGYGSLAGISGCNMTGVIACTSTWIESGSSSIVDSDIRFSDAVSWYSISRAYWDEQQRVPGSYDVDAVNTNQVGHMIGLDAVTAVEDASLTMFYQTCPGCLKQRTLGLGDVNGLNVYYPF